MRHSKYLKQITLITMVTTFVLAFAGCKSRENFELNGYIEAEPVLVASSQSGTLTQLHVTKGDWVKPESQLFNLEQANELAQVAEAQATYQRLTAIVEDNIKGKRPEELAALHAELDSAKASLKLSEIDLKRQADLIKSGYTSKSNLDSLTAQRDKNLALVAELNAQIKLAELGTRQDLLQASKEEALAAKAKLDQAQWRLDQKTLILGTPHKARVEDIYFRLGEWVPAGTPVVKLQMLEFIKARFFIPEPMLPKIKLGQKIKLLCDGCQEDLFATVSFISDHVEFTPPVIFSEQNRERLVFMIEATPLPTQAVYLKAGQPIQIHWENIE